ncbi:MAG: deoxyribonuclease IV [Bacteroidota bacterium]|jgi:deoxyribonuclease-4
MEHFLGVHCSVSGGLENAFGEANGLHIDVMQVFTRNQRQWNAKPISDEERIAFQDTWKSSQIKVAFSHCSYLINLAAESDETREKSIAALILEVERCTLLGLSFCILHPGAAGSQTQETAIKKIADGLRQVLDKSSGSNVMILLENTAGQGSSVGGPFENLKQISDLTNSKRIGYCFDTCHAFAAGFDIRTKKGCEETFAAFDSILGLENLKAFHLNDSKGDLGSHLDRHEHIGKGKLGLEPFRYIMNNFPKIPKVIETEKSDEWDRENLELLKSLI